MVTVGVMTGFMGQHLEDYSWYVNPIYNFKVVTYIYVLVANACGVAATFVFLDDRNTCNLFLQNVQLTLQYMCENCDLQYHSLSWVILPCNTESCRPMFADISQAR